MHIRRMSDKQHAVFAIARSLEALKLHTWTHVLLTWLGQYDGLECYMEDEDNPSFRVRDLLARYVATGTRVFPKTIAADFSRLPFLHYQAKLTNGVDWESLKIPFIEFAQTGNVEVWRSSTPYPEPAMTQAYLLSAFVRCQLSDDVSGKQRWLQP